MELLFAGLIGVVTGAVLASIIILRVYEKRGDRDLVERRLRACFEFRECLGDLEEAFEGSSEDARLLEQAWHNVGGFCREFHLKGWLFPPDVHSSLRAIVDELERGEKSYRENGSNPAGRVVQLLCEKSHQVDRILRRESERQLKEFRRIRFLPERPASQDAQVP